MGAQVTGLEPMPRTSSRARANWGAPPAVASSPVSPGRGLTFRLADGWLTYIRRPCITVVV